MIPRTNPSVRAVSSSGSGGLPTMKENSGTIPCLRIRPASSSVFSAGGCRPCPSAGASPPTPTPRPGRPCAARRAHGPPGRLVVPQQRVDPPLAPPGEAQPGDALGDLDAARFGREEVVVVELHRVHALVGDVSLHHVRHAPGRLGPPASRRHADDPAEVAGERAAVARVVPEVRRPRNVSRRYAGMGRRWNGNGGRASGSGTGAMFPVRRPRPCRPIPGQGPAADRSPARGSPAARGRRARRDPGPRSRRSPIRGRPPDAPSGSTRPTRR